MISSEVAERHAVGACNHVRRDEANQDHRAADEGIEHQLHGRILAAGRSPDSDQEVLGNHYDLVEDKEQEQIEAEEDAIDCANQDEVEREELLDPMVNIP